MSHWTFDRVFACLFVVGLIIAALGVSGVLSDSTQTIIAALTAVAMILFLVVLGGPHAKTGVLVLTLVAALGIAPDFAPERASGEFYSAAAQIIPVLLLVLALEARLFEIRWLVPVTRHVDESWLSHFRRRLETDSAAFGRATVLSVTLFALVAGELQALDSLASERPERSDPRHVYSAVVVGLIVVAFLALFGSPRAKVERDERT